MAINVASITWDPLWFLLHTLLLAAVVGVVLSDPRGSVAKHRYLKKGSVPAMIPTPPLVAGECVICDKAFKNKPLVLVLEYQPTGKDSCYQDESKATCVAGSYPSPTRVEVENGQGDSQEQGDLCCWFVSLPYKRRS
jgi:hypothetical protein